VASRRHLSAAATPAPARQLHLEGRPAQVCTTRSQKHHKAVDTSWEWSIQLCVVVLYKCSRARQACAGVRRCASAKRLLSVPLCTPTFPSAGFASQRSQLEATGVPACSRQGLGRRRRRRRRRPAVSGPEIAQTCRPGFGSCYRACYVPVFRRCRALRGKQNREWAVRALSVARPPGACCRCPLKHQQATQRPERLRTPADPPSRAPSRCSCTHREVASLPQQAGLTSCALKASSLCGGRCVARRVPGCKQRLGDAGLNGRNGDRAGLQPSQCHEGWHKKRRSARALHCTPPPLYPAHPWHSPGSPSRSPSGL
jgi:hypothetical protein